MSRNSFRWWYLVFLLPVVLYLGARLYVDGRIQSALDRANADGNELTLGRYQFSLLPLGLTVDSVRFDQERAAFTARGTLGHAALSGVDLVQLIRKGRYELGQIEVDRLDADLSLSSTDSSGGPGTDLQLDDLSVTDSRIRVRLPGGDRRLLLTGGQLTHRNLRLPFSLSQLERTDFLGDSLLFTSGDDLRVLALGPSLDEETRSVTARNLTVVRRGTGPALDLEMDKLLLDAPDLTSLERGDYSVDRLQIGRVAGTIALDSATGSTAPAPRIRIDRLNLPEIDLDVSGPFGRAVVAGGHLEQAGLHYPLNDSLPGATWLQVDSLRLALERGNGQFADLEYDSEKDRLMIGPGRVDLPANRAGASWVGLTANGIPRAALLRGQPPTIGSATVNQLEGELTNDARSRYLWSVPEVAVETLEFGDRPTLSTLRVAGARLKRYDAGGHLRLDVEDAYLTQGALNLSKLTDAPGPTQLRVAQLLLVDEDDADDYCIRGIRYDSPAANASAEALLRRTAEPVLKILRTTEEKSVTEYSFGQIRVTGIDREGLLDRRRGRATAVRAQSFELIVMEDPAKPPSPDYRPLPLEALRGLPFPVIVDEVTVARAEVEYAIVSETYEPKSIFFREGEIALRGVDTRVSATDSVIATMSATFQRTTPVDIRFALARSASGRDYGMSGSMGRYDLTDINPLMDVAARVTVDAGVVDRLQYSAELRGDTLRGDMTFLYHDLDVTPKGALGFFKNLAAGLVVKDENTEEDFRPGKMFFTYDDSRAFFNIYWRGLVSGMKSSALGNIALPDELEIE